MHLKKWTAAGAAWLLAFTVLPTAALGEAAGYAPLRLIGEKAGAVIQWDDENRTAVWSRGAITVRFPEGSETVQWNGQTVPLEGKVKMEDSRIWVPASFLKEMLGVEWTGDGTAVEAVTLGVTGKAREIAEQLQQGKGTGEFPLSVGLRSLLTADKAALYWPAAEKQLGKLVPTAEKPILVSNEVHISATIPFASQNGLVDFTVRFLPSGEVDDFGILPRTGGSGPYDRADYDNSSLYSEQEVKFGPAPWTLPGTLTVPQGEGPFPAVVLVHGSGPNDRDESYADLKPFRDLAAGLASQGIAVLRYEKRTKEHGLKFSLEPGYTVNQETVEDALYAVNFLSGQPQVDASRIYVIGHSLGGMMIPRIVKGDTEGRIAGTVVMAGPAKPLEDVMADQFAYFASLHLISEQQAQFMRKQADLLKAPSFDVSRPPEGFALGSPAYWYDLRNTYAPEQARTLKGRMLILQGERDYQVTKDHLDLWRKALADRSDVSFVSYPLLNHFFMAGEGPGTPSEYLKPGHMSSGVIRDIAHWIKNP